MSEIGKQHQSANSPPGFTQPIRSWLHPHTADHITLTSCCVQAEVAPKALGGGRACDLVFRLHMFSSSFGPLTQSIGKTCVEQVLTPTRDGIILRLWDVLADGRVEHLHFQFNVVSFEEFEAEPTCELESANPWSRQGFLLSLTKAIVKLTFLRTEERDSRNLLWVLLCQA